VSTFENLRKVRSILSDSKKIGSHNERFINATRKGNEGRIDKYKKGFNEDSRFQAFRVEVFFGSYTGAYGDSSVGSFLNISSAVSTQKAFVKYLQDNEDDVLQGISDNLREEADSLIEAAKSEISDASEYINSICADDA
jgi:hypothetical protein